MCIFAVISHWVVVVLQTEGKVVILLVGESTLRDFTDVVLVRPVLLQNWNSDKSTFMAALLSKDQVKFSELTSDFSD